ncbi:hypothetical protein DL93DRAFT_2167602 [Clavulina sp. PMI_390]|nr:hypothetical protein DL93DRAFT_2167602 [Clavulina sp. PMI_390]
MGGDTAVNDDDGQAYAPKQRKNPGKRAERKRSNATTVCVPCRSKHSACDGTPDNPEISCSSCKKGNKECTWRTTVDKRRNITKQAYQQQEVLIRRQKEMIDALVKDRSYLADLARSRNIKFQLPSDATASSSTSEPQPYPFHDRRGLVDDDRDIRSVSRGFGSMVLHSDTANMFGPGAQPTMPRLVHIDGYSHSTSRMLHVTPLHELTGHDTELAPGWATYLPHDVNGNPLITRAQHDSVLMKCFLFITPLTLRVIPHLFLRDLANWTASPNPKPNLAHYSPMLHNVILAISLAFSDIPEMRSREFRDKFIVEAKKWHDQEMEHPNLSTVQGLALLSTYYSSWGEHTLGWNTFGTANHVAYTLGLHVSVPDRRVANDDHIERTWVYWSVSTHHKLWQLFVGRNQASPLKKTNGKYPPPQIDFRLDHGFVQWTTPDGRMPKTKGLLSTSFIAEVKLMDHTPGIMKAIFDENFDDRATSMQKVHEVTNLWQVFRTVYCTRQSICEWYNGLPPELRIDTPVESIRPPHIWVMNLTCQWLKLLLLQSFYQSELRPRDLQCPPAGVQTQFQTHPTNLHSDLGHASSRARPGTLEQRQGERDFRGLVALANKECVQSADHALALLDGYNKWFGLENTSITMVQIVHQIGETSLRGIIAGMRDGAGKRTVLAGGKACSRVQECIKSLKVIGKTYPTALEAAQRLDTALTKLLEQWDLKRKEVKPQETLSKSGFDAFDGMHSLGLDELEKLSGSDLPWLGNPLPGSQVIDSALLSQEIAENIPAADLGLLNGVQDNIFPDFQDFAIPYTTDEPGFSSLFNTAVNNLFVSNDATAGTSTAPISSSSRSTLPMFSSARVTGPAVGARPMSYTSQAPSTLGHSTMDISQPRLSDRVPLSTTANPSPTYNTPPDATAVPLRGMMAANRGRGTIGTTSSTQLHGSLRSRQDFRPSAGFPSAHNVIRFQPYGQQGRPMHRRQCQGSMRTELPHEESDDGTLASHTD